MPVNPSIQAYVDKQKAFNDRQAAAIDSVVASQGGLTEDIKTLNDKITELQNNPGPISPDDQALLDSMVTLSEATVTKSEGVAAALKALDEQTPPPTPPTPPA